MKVEEFLICRCNPLNLLNCSTVGLVTNSSALLFQLLCCCRLDNLTPRATLPLECKIKTCLLLLFGNIFIFIEIHKIRDTRNTSCFSCPGWYTKCVFLSVSLFPYLSSIVISARKNYSLPTIKEYCF